MKTLGKLKLKAEKMLNSEELLGFRGGSGGSGWCYGCHSITAYQVTWCVDRCMSDPNLNWCVCCCKLKLCGGGCA